MPARHPLVIDKISKTTLFINYQIFVATNIYLIGEWINRLWNPCYEILFSDKNKLTFNPPNIFLSKRSQSKMATYCMI
jgi:hypothetical protein